MAVQDLGIRIVILGVAESRRAIGSVKSDLSGLERAIRGVSGASAGLGTSLTQMGNAMMGFGRTLSLFLTAPIVFAGASMLKAGMDYEDAFAGVAKTTEGVAWGIREVLKWTPGYLDGALEILALSNQQSIANHEAEETWMTLDQALDIYISQLSDAEKATLIAHENFGQLTEAGQALKDTFLDLSLKIPVSAAELAEIGRAAGQMGVPMDQLEGFVETIAKITFATEMEGEEAAMSMARFARILGVTSEGLAGFAGEYGDVLIHLGNISAATEPEINTLALRLAALGPIAGLSMEEILGLSAAITEMGIAPERGGTAMRRFFLEIGYAIADGNENLGTFAAQLNMTGDEFIKAFGEDPANLVLNLMESIAEAQEKNLITGEQMTAWGLGGVRVTEFLQILGSNLPRVTELMNEANKAKILGIALDEESAKRWRTLSSQIQILKNHIAALAIEIYNLYYKDLKKLVAGMQQVVKIFMGLPDNVKKSVVAFAAFAAALGPALVAFGLFLQTAGTSISFFTGALSPLLRIVPLFSGAFFPIAAALGAVYLAFKTNLGGIRTEIERFIGSIKSSKFIDFLEMWFTDTIANAKKGNWELIRELGMPVLADELARVMGLVGEENTLIPKITNFVDSVEREISLGLDRIKRGWEGFADEIENVDFSFVLPLGKLAVSLLLFGWVLATTEIERNLPKLGEAFALFTQSISALSEGHYDETISKLGDSIATLASADFLGVIAGFGVWHLVLGPILTGLARKIKAFYAAIVAHPLVALGILTTGAVIASYFSDFGEFKTKVDELGQSIRNLGDDITVGNFLQAMWDLGEAFLALVTAPIEELTGNLSSFAKTAIGAAVGAGLLFLALSLGIAPILLIPAAILVLIWAFGQLKDAIYQVVEKLDENSELKLALAAAATAFAVFGLAIGAPVLAIAGLGLAIAALVHYLINDVDWSAIEKGWEDFKNLINEIWEIIKSIPGALRQLFTKVAEFSFPQAWEDFKNLLSEIWNFISWIAGASPPSWLPGAGGGASGVGAGQGKFNTYEEWKAEHDRLVAERGMTSEEAAAAIGPWWPGGATGATVTPGKPIWVGETGRELLWPKIPGVITSHRDSKKIVKLLTRTFSTNQAITRLLTRPSVYVPRTPSVYHSVYSPNFYAPPTQELISTNRSMYSDWLYAQQKG